VTERESISEGDAIRIAREVTRGKVELGDNPEITVAKHGDVYTVTFLTNDRSNTLRADYDAQIEIDAVTGKVREFKLGS
jgi:hypothetical protein